MPVDKSVLVRTRYMVIFDVCDGSIFGDAAELIVSPKGTINGPSNPTLGFRILYTIHLA